MGIGCDTKATDKLDTNKVKKTLCFKGYHQENKKREKTPREWEKSFCKLYDKGLATRIYKELLKLNTKKTNNSFNY